MATLRSILTSPLFTSIASIASIVSLLLGIYYGQRGAPGPELTLSINPAKLEVVSSGQTSSLSVSFDGKPVPGDITTTQVAVWNAGEVPIRRSDVLQAVVIYTDPKTPILEASIRKSSRDIIGFSLSADEIQLGRIPVSWDVLEKGDGALIEVIYAGSPEIDFKAEGAIIGQKEIIKFQNRIGFQSPADEFEAARTRHRRVRFFSIPLAALSLGGAIFTVRQIFTSKRRHEYGMRSSLITMTVLLVIMAGLFVALFVLSRYPTAPAGL